MLQLGSRSRPAIWRWSCEALGAKAAGAGGMLNIHDLKAAYETAIGHETSNSTVYNLLARHGWRKLMPRPFHPKRDLAAQNAFKKTASQML